MTGKNKRGFRLPTSGNYGKVNIFGKLIAYVGYLSRSILAPTFHLLHGHKTSLGGGIYSSLHFWEASAFSLIKYTLGRLFLHWQILICLSLICLLKINLYAKVAYSASFQLLEIELLKGRNIISSLFAWVAVSSRQQSLFINICWVNEQSPSTILAMNSYGVPLVHTYYSTKEEFLENSWYFGSRSFGHSLMVKIHID